MAIDKEMATYTGGGLALLVWLYRILRGEWRATRNEASEQSLIARLQAEVARKDLALEAKEATISRLVREKADLMGQLSEIPRLRDEIRLLEEQVQGLVKLFGHLIKQEAIRMDPETNRAFLQLLAGVTAGMTETEGSGR